MGSIGKIPWRREWKPTPVFLPGESYGQRSLEGYRPWGHKESDTIKCLTLYMKTTDEDPSYELVVSNAIKRRRQWQPTPVLLPGESHEQRSLVGCSPWGSKELDTTERLHFHFSLSCIGEGNGNPLQCSCLENPRDCGAWWAAVYGVAQSWTRLKRLSSSSSSNAIKWFESHHWFLFQCFSNCMFMTPRSYGDTVEGWKILAISLYPITLPERLSHCSLILLSQ